MSWPGATGPVGPAGGTPTPTCPECLGLPTLMTRKAVWLEEPAPGGVLYYWECPDCEHTIPELGQA